jgi:uncharacterized protein YxeA
MKNLIMIIVVALSFNFVSFAQVNKSLSVVANSSDVTGSYSLFKDTETRDRINTLLKEINSQIYLSAVYQHSKTRNYAATAVDMSGEKTKLRLFTITEKFNLLYSEFKTPEELRIFFNKVTE